jgi:hypothetical protein
MALRQLDPLYSPEGDEPAGGAGQGGDSEPQGDGGAEDSSSSEAPSYPSFHNQFPERLRGHEAFGQKSLGEIAEQFVELAGRQDKVVELPGEDASPEKRQEFYRKLGVPEKPAGYEFKKPEDWPASYPWDQKDAQAFAEAAYKSNLTKEQAETFYKTMMNRNRDLLDGSFTNNKKERDEWNNALQRKFGDNAPAKLELADRAMEMIGSPALKQKLEQVGLTRYPPLVDAFLKAWNEIGEDKIFAGVTDRSGTNYQEQVSRRYPNTKF